MQGVTFSMQVWTLRKTNVAVNIYVQSRPKHVTLCSLNRSKFIIIVLTYSPCAYHSTVY